MGTSNFCYEHRLDVIQLSSVHDWNDPEHIAAENADREAEGLPLVSEDDWEYFADQATFQIDSVVEMIQNEAYKMQPYNRALNHRNVCIYSEKIDRDSRLARSRYDNSYGGLTIARVHASTDVGGLDIQAEIELVLRSGYYDGANIDPILSVGSSYEMCDWEEGYDPTPDIRDDLLAHSGLSEAQANALYRVRNGCKRSSLELATDAVIRAAWIEYERLVSDFVEPYTEFSRFSNGETWYCRKENHV